MEELGYQRYGAHGGDWGSGISRALGAVAPAHVVGVHLGRLGEDLYAQVLAGHHALMRSALAA